MPISSSPAKPNNANTVQTALQQNSINTDENTEIPLAVNKTTSTSSENSHVFWQVLPVKISNGNKSVTVNVFFYSGSSSTLLAQKCSKLFKFKWKKQSIIFPNESSQKPKVKSKLIKFSLSSKLHPMGVEFENTWVANEVNLIPYRIK